jgi:HPt (histidine-containing phosphotransfer) domain-containing protein
MKGDREHCLAVGMDDYLSKPFTEEQLADLLRKWLPVRHPSTPGKQEDDPLARQAEIESDFDGKQQDGEERKENSEEVFDDRVLENFRQIQRPDQPDIVKRLITIYLKSSPPLLDKIQAALALEDHEGLWQAAHSLKSSSANLGAVRLAQLCEELEIEGRAGRLGRAEELVESIRQEFGRAETWLRKKAGL